jgi:putative ABC transport system permease protein
VRAISALPQVSDVHSGLLLTASAGDLDLVVEVITDGAQWTPTLTAGTTTGGLVLAEKAARDLNVQVGDPVTLTHPQATPAGLRTVSTSMQVVGLHPNPMRMLAYLDPATASVFGLTGSTNLLTVTPAPGTGTEQVRPALLAVPHVAAAQTARATTAGMRASLDEFLCILQVAALVTLLLALLIAFNTTSIGIDERAREHATMLAFGLPTRTVLALTAVETALLGAAGAVTGILGGYGVLRWLTATTIPNVLPDIGVSATLSTTTIIQALTLGILTVALAPLLTARRLRRTDIPAALRVVE